MGIFELAAELGRTLKNDKRLIALEEAKRPTRAIAVCKS